MNILPGFGETAGAAIAGHEGIDKVAAVGLGREMGEEVLNNYMETKFGHRRPLTLPGHDPPPPAPLLRVGAASAG